MMTVRKDKDCLIWDFDGVIADSMEECLLTSYNAFVEYAGLPGGFIGEAGGVPDPVRKEIYRTRRFVGRAGEYLILHKAILSNRPIDDYGTFEKLLDGDIESIPAYEELFFAMRGRLRKSRPDYWLGLHHVYPWVKERWDMLEREFDFYIASNKDKLSISLILRHAGLKAEEGNIFGKDFDTDKKRITKELIGGFDIPAERVALIDDNYRHLLRLRDLGIRLFFADWGYGEMVDGPEAGIFSVGREDFHKKLLDRRHEQVC
jgi:phosphoglycolate phosphatase-like HAD superfamily hydrolase